MKKIKISLFLVIVALSGFIFSSCKKETTERNMVIRNWNLESKTVAGVDVAGDCEEDSKWNFKADGTFAIYDDCDNTQTGTWELDEDATTLTLNNVTVYKVIENSIFKLIIEMQVGGIGLVRWKFN
jgi:heat shock protein HslJ